MRPSAMVTITCPPASSFRILRKSFGKFVRPLASMATVAFPMKDSNLMVFFALAIINQFYPKSTIITPK